MVFIFFNIFKIK